MKYQEVLDRIDKLNKDNIIIYQSIFRNYTSISLHYKGVRILDLTNPQFEKLKKLGYIWETLICKR